MPRAVLPQNYVLSPGNVWCDFQGDQTDWDYPASHSINMVEFKGGDRSLKVSAAADYFTSKVISENLATIKTFGLWLYCHDLSPIVKVSLVSMNIRSVTNYAKYFYMEVGGNSLCHGWNYISVDREEWTNVGSESWDNTMLRVGLRVKPVTGQSAVVSFGGIYKNYESLSRVMIGFDDGAGSVITDAYPYMAARGISGTAFVNSGTIGTEGKMTAANLDTLYGVGWAVANHCSVHTDLTTITPTAASTLVTTGRDWLLARGYDRSAYHLAYPYGYYNYDVLGVCRDAGCLTGRIATGYKFTPSEGRDNLIMPARYVNRTDSLATLTGWVDQAYAAGKTIPLIFHKILDAPALTDEWSTTNFQGFVDYIVARRMVCVTIDEWYRGLTDPRSE